MWQCVYSVSIFEWSHLPLVNVAKNVFLLATDSLCHNAVEQIPVLVLWIREWHMISKFTNICMPNIYDKYWIYSHRPRLISLVSIKTERRSFGYKVRTTVDNNIWHWMLFKFQCRHWRQTSHYNNRCVLNGITVLSLPWRWHIDMRSRSRNKRRNLRVGWCVSSWRPWF